MKHKDIILQKDNKITTKYGSSCVEEKPQVLYLRSKAKITPTKQKDTFENDVNKIKNKFQEYIFKQMKQSKVFDDICICNIDISSKSVSYNKISFLRYDVFFKPLVKNTIEKHLVSAHNLSNKLDKYLIKLLNQYNIDYI